MSMSLMKRDPPEPLPPTSSLISTFVYFKKLLLSHISIFHTQITPLHSGLITDES